MNIARQNPGRKKKLGAGAADPIPVLPTVNLLTLQKTSTAEKKADIKAIMKFMGEVDKTFYRNLFANH